MCVPESPQHLCPCPAITGDSEVPLQGGSDGPEGGGAHSHSSQHEWSEDHHPQGQGQVQDRGELHCVEVNGVWEGGEVGGVWEGGKVSGVWEEGRGV